MRAVLTREEMRAADAAALASVSHETLVRRAGTAVAYAALRLLGGAYGRRVVVVAGKGSNGADGRVAAAFLTRRGARVSVLEAEDVGPGAALPPCDLVVDGAYGTGFRGTYDARRRRRPEPRCWRSTSRPVSTPTRVRHRATPCGPTAR